MAAAYSAVLTRGALAVCESCPAGVRLSVGFATFEGRVGQPAFAAWLQSIRRERRRLREDLTLWLWLGES